MTPIKDFEPLDRTDRRILEVLQRDASYSVTRLAEEIGLSKSACWRRIQGLEERGVITARVALLDQKKLGLDLTVYTAIRTLEHTKSWYDNFSRVVTTMPNVMEVHRMSGEIDYLMRSVTRDHAQLFAIEYKGRETFLQRLQAAFTSMLASLGIGAGRW